MYGPLLVLDVDELLKSLFVDPEQLPEGFGGMVQILFLSLVYGYLLFMGANLISDGSELLLLIPSLSGIVGSVVLPVLGAVPDGAIVVFSGLGPNAQDKLDVGVGTLAGSTIMLLTVPWSLSILAGRVNLDSLGRGSYTKPKLVPANHWSLRGTGVNCHSGIQMGGYIMLATSLSYFMIQGSAFSLGCDLADAPCRKAKGELGWALAGMLYCGVAFVAYLVYQVQTAGGEPAAKRRVDMVRSNIKAGAISLSAAFSNWLSKKNNNSLGVGEATPLLVGKAAEDERLFRQSVIGFFDEFDTDRNGLIDQRELVHLFSEMGESVSEEQVHMIMQDGDKDDDGVLTKDEFVDALKRYLELKRKHEFTSLPPSQQLSPMPGLSDAEGFFARTSGSADEDGDEDSDEEEVPEDLAHLSEDQQQRRILLRSFYTMGGGTLLVLLFSDPMVAVMDVLAKRIGISAFYVAFVMAPLASNASELMASYNYAAKKTRKSITISFQQLEGAACMNNTFCLGLFLALVYFRGLVWEFAAETISILLVQILMFFMTQKTTHTLLDAILVLLLYPLSLIVVYGLEAAGLD